MKQSQIASNMGSYGQRPTRVSKRTYEEPALLKDVDTITQYAREKGYYSGEILDLDSAVSMFPDIKVEYAPMEQTQSGELFCENGIWVIKINQKHNKKRQRFTLAHELGHYILHKEKNTGFKDAVFFRNEILDSMEYSANEFASQLLMPESNVRRSIDIDGIRNVGQLAETFGVSAAAMKYRIISLGYTLK